MGDFVTEKKSCALPKMAAGEFRVIVGEVSGLWNICNDNYENSDYLQTLFIFPAILHAGSTYL
jgi:hypothetical protein